jgi:transcription-repair coupling factor (superfamily II helicase)
MQLSGLLPALRALPEYHAALGALAEKARRGFALGLPRSARIPVSAALAEDAHSPVLVIAARIDRALTFAEELAAWNPSRRVLPFNEPTPLFYEYEAWDARSIRARITALAALTQTPNSNSNFIVVASARALMTLTLPPRDFLANTRTLEAGQPVRLEKLIETWVGAGYAAGTIVVEPGQFARRGGIIDIYPMADALPARIELFGDEVETIRRFDPATQRSGESVESLTITPAREALPKHAKDEGGRMKDEDSSLIPNPSYLEFQLPLMLPPASLLEYLPEPSLVLVDDWQELADTVSEFEEQAVQLRGEQLEAGLIDEDFPLPYHPWAELQDELSERAPLFLAARTDEEGSTVNLGARFRPGPRYGGQLKPLLDHLRDLQVGHDRAVVVTRQSQRLAELWGEHHTHIAPTDSLAELPAEGSLTFVQGALSEGWILKDEGGTLRVRDEDSSFIPHPSSLHLLTDSEIFGWARPEPRRRARQAALAPEASYADFAPGDFVVHADFGIGRFRELVKRAVDGLEREYLLLEYADGDELYVPIHQTDQLTRYVGADDHPPTLSRLGSAEWQTIRSRTQQAVEELAKEMLELYARREITPGRAFGADTPWQAEIEAAFPYVETDDQLRAIREVKADMEKPRPMDRLICGDVGYGKTEVALRAAFKAVMDGAQVAVLVPTTVLAQQHLHTFQSRLAPYPVKVEMLSRFRSPAEAKRIVEQMAEGAVDIVIGTHRLLQKDVGFKNLGLLIIDEEQRFGVTHKERLKQMRTEVDVLTLTATPIPRTLYMSLTGVRDISTINTPPEERLPIVTHSGPYNERLVRQAILRELDRGGQVFFVHNRVQSIGVVRHKLERLIPEARIGLGHGQMDEHELSRVMDQFTAGEIDILLCTSIIESGLDIPNANTLIVDRADTFGLAQLYQLRGRVGRGAAQAYTYLFTDRKHRPTPEARERLDTIVEQTELGAGYSIAMRDLEMRGAGDLLGPRQSGHISAVGFHLYTRLLAQAVRKLKIQDSSSRIQMAKTPLNLESWNLDIAVSVDLPLAASLPSDYVPDRGLRLQLYRRLANLTEEDDVAAMGAELADRFGPLPRPVENLLYQLRVKIRAARAGVSAVAGEAGQIVLVLPLREDGDYGASLGSVGPGVRVSKNKIWLSPPKGDIRRAASEEAWREQLLEVLARLAEARAQSQPAFLPTS